MKFIEVAERLPEALALLDRQARLRYVNSSAERLFGKPRIELLGEVAWHVVLDPIGPALRTAFEQILGGGAEVLVLRSFFAKGRWYDLTAKLVGDEIILFGPDITERLQAEAFRQAEDRFQIFVDSVKDYAISAIDLTGHIVSWNIGGERLLGYRAGEILGTDHSIVYPPEDEQRPRRNLEAAIAHGHHDYSGWLVRKDGSRLWADCSISPLYDQRGQPSGFAVVMRDVTEHRRMQEEIRNSEERLRLATDAAGVGTWDFRVETGQWMPDARCLGLFGLPPDTETFRTRQEIIARIHPADRERANAAWDQALAGGEYHLEYRVINDGGERWIESRGKALPDSVGKPVRMIGVCRDVTERHRYDEFRQLLPGILAHDLRSPLSTIRMASQMLLKSAALPPSATQYADATCAARHR